MSQSPNPVAAQQVAHLLASATELLRAGRPADAIAPLREAALLEPFNAIIQHDLGLACLEVGRVPDAIAALQQAVASNPRYADAHFRLGIAWKSWANIGGAIVAYDRATELLPSLTEAWFRVGALVYTLGHRDEAIGCFRRAAATGGKTSFGRLGKARALLTEDRNQEAEQSATTRRWRSIRATPWRTICWAICSLSSAVSTRPRMLRTRDRDRAAAGGKLLRSGPVSPRHERRRWSAATDGSRPGHAGAGSGATPAASPRDRQGGGRSWRLRFGHAAFRRRRRRARRRCVVRLGRVLASRSTA